MRFFTSISLWNVLLASLITLVIGCIAALSWIASPGLPLTKSFADSPLQDGSQTDASWPAEEHAAYSQRRNLVRIDQATWPSTGTAVGSSDADQTLSIALGDIDGDGDLDMVAGNRNRTNKLYLNNGSASPFNHIANGTAVGSSDTDLTYSIALGDVDGDGDLDVVVGNNGQTNKLYLNNGSASPFNHITNGTAIGSSDTDDTVSIALGDVDGDGDLDVIAGNLGQNKVYLNDGSASPFDSIINGAPVGSLDADITRSVALGDVDGDGDLDVIAGNYGQNRMYLNDGDAAPFDSVTNGTALGSSDADLTRSIALGDVDGDGDLDVIAGNTKDGRYSLPRIPEPGQNKLYLNNGSASPFNHIANGTPVGSLDANNTRSVALGDVDGDGDLDVVVGNRGRANKVYLNNGTASPFDHIANGTAVGSSDTDLTRPIALGDVDGDGDLDVVVGNLDRSNNLGQKNKVYLNLAFDVGVDIWPQFRGPKTNPALEDNPSLPSAWSTTENVEWVTDIPGLGWSSPVVWGNKVFLTSVDAADNFEQPKEELYDGERRPLPLDMEQGWIIYCLALDSGEVLWKKQVHAAKPAVGRHPDSSYASETPTTDGERVYVLFGDVGLYCLDMDGNEVWTRKIEARKTRTDYGAAASPILYDDMLIMVYDNKESSYIAAYDKATGEERWRAARDEETSWATPFIWKNEFRTEIVTSGQNRIRSYDLKGGLLWEMDGRMSWSCIPTPFASHGLLYVNSGYIQDRHRPVYAIRPGARGDITMEEDQKSSEFVAWYQPEAGNYRTSPLVYRGLYYSALARGSLECYDALRGNRVYSQRKIDRKGPAHFTSSPWAYNGMVFCLSEQGKTYVVEAGRKFKLLRQNSLEEKCKASPAIVGDRLLIRTISKLYSIKTDVIHVDFGNSTGDENGEISWPWNSLGEALGTADSNAMIKIHGDSLDTDSSETLTISQPVTITAVDGTVTIGAGNR